MKIFWLNVDIVLDVPLFLENDNGKMSKNPIDGALMEFGVTASDEDTATKMVSMWISDSEQFKDSKLEIRFDHIGTIANEDIDKEIYQDSDVNSCLLQEPTKIGIWYRTGVGWYSE